MIIQPLPTNLPGHIETRLCNLIGTIANSTPGINVTALNVVTSPLIRSLFVQTFSTVHPTMANMDTIRRQVTKFHRIYRPFGTDVLGVYFDFHRNKCEIREYLRTLQVTSGGKMIFIAMLRKAAETLVQLRGFEIDMTFKGVLGDMNEIKLVYFHLAYEMTLTFARVFTNVKNADGYESIFDALMEVCERPTWRHMDEEGY